MQKLLGKLVIIAGVILLPIALSRTVVAATQLFKILFTEDSYADWTYYVWMPTTALQDWLIAIGFILAGFGISSKSEERQPPPPQAH